MTNVLLINDSSSNPNWGDRAAAIALKRMIAACGGTLGGIVTEDALRSLVISSSLLGTREYMIINHTDCGMLTFKDEELRERLIKQTGTSVAAPACFHTFSDVEENVRGQLSKVRHHPWIDKSIPVRGFVFDVKSGALKEVK